MTIKPKSVIIISGATATGKSKLGIKIARLIGRERAVIVNFDSLLFYRELKIGTAAPSEQEREGIKHYLVGGATIASPLNAHDFVLEANRIISELHQNQQLVLLVGGSGFYLRALLQGMYDSPSTPLSIKEKVRELYCSQGINPFWNLLSTVDPEAKASLHVNDHYRIIRAVEHFWAHGSKFSETRSMHQKYLQKSLRDWQILHLHLQIPKEIHHQIIRARVLVMLAQGFEQEVRGLLKLGFSGFEKPLRSIGYKQMLEYLRGELDSIEEFVEKTVIATKHLAKAQRTWFQKIPDKLTFNSLSDEEKILDVVEKFL